MSKFDYFEMEAKWKKKWEKDKVFQNITDEDKEKFYCLDMFPYPSGAGLHVGHPLGYIASDIVSRFKRLKGFNVLHPMGFDSFGLPAEQYAIETGQPPELTTKSNIANFKAQLSKMGLSIDVSREIKTSDPSYYKWTQWIFLRLFNSWYDNNACKARHIDSLVSEFELNGNLRVNAESDNAVITFTPEQWQAFSGKEKQDILMCYRLAYCSLAYVNWCPKLGTVLANDEVVGGFSERGGHPVERKKMHQWMLRITAYADRLLNNLPRLDWPAPLKEMQKNWIGHSEGVSVRFQVENREQFIDIFTSKPEGLFCVTFVCVSPEHSSLDQLITGMYKGEVENYLSKISLRSERDIAKAIDTPSGVFTGSYVVHPISRTRIPIWIGDHVLASSGTGVVLGVPAGDERDYRFSSYYGLGFIEMLCINTGNLCNSSFLDGYSQKEAREEIIKHIEVNQLGKRTVNYRIRDAIFGRQRYWGEPIPIYFDSEGIAKGVKEDELPIVLPTIDKYLPDSEGRPPLSRAKDWLYQGKYCFEFTTMPGWAGSSWYFHRYVSPDNKEVFVNRKDSDYWRAVDLYVGGGEHATGHLLYARFWNQFLFDLDLISFEEPFENIVNQGMIQGESAFIYRLKGSNTFVSATLKSNYDVTPLYVDVNMVGENNQLDTGAFKAWRSDFNNAEFIFDGAKFFCDRKTEKMSKSKHNVANPDEVITEYGADVFRLYMMYLGPLKQSKVWSLSGIKGLSKFLIKLRRLFVNDHGEVKNLIVQDLEEHYDVLNIMLVKVESDLNSMSFNTAIAAMIVCVNELTRLCCIDRNVLESLLIALSPFAVFTTQELWTEALGNDGYIVDAEFPSKDNDLVVSNTITCPITINGRVRTRIEFQRDTDVSVVKDTVYGNSVVKKWLDGKEIKKFIYIPNKIANIVI
jgi:leucyl-tRNA synthetase